MDCVIICRVRSGQLCQRAEYTMWDIVWVSDTGAQVQVCQTQISFWDQQWREDTIRSMLMLLTHRVLSWQQHRIHKTINSEKELQCKKTLCHRLHKNHECHIHTNARHGTTKLNSTAEKYCIVIATSTKYAMTFEATENCYQNERWTGHAFLNTHLSWVRQITDKGKITTNGHW